MRLEWPRRADASSPQRALARASTSRGSRRGANAPDGHSTETPPVVFATAPVDARGRLVPDAHLATLMRQHDVGVIYTRDRGFRRFDGIRVRAAFHVGQIKQFAEAATFWTPSLRRVVAEVFRIQRLERTTALRTRTFRGMHRHLTALIQRQ